MVARRTLGRNPHLIGPAAISKSETSAEIFKFDPSGATCGTLAGSQLNIVSAIVSADVVPKAIAKYWPQMLPCIFLSRSDPPVLSAITKIYAPKILNSVGRRFIQLCPYLPRNTVG